MHNEIIEIPPVVIEIITKPLVVVDLSSSKKPLLEMQYTAPGPKGDPGVNGKDGVDGKDGKDGIDATYTHTQIASSTIWLIQHNLDKRPSISIVDSADTLIIGDVTYIDNNNCQVEFSIAISGKVYCN